ncbi:MAG: hypothetical protein ACMG6E_09385 [Candidatus Roizmanbacteria bacterium]
MRSSYKSKNFDYRNNPLLEESSDDEEEYGSEEDQEAQTIESPNVNKK